MLEAVLFDLDGTLADTAPDLGNALNRLLDELRLPRLPIDAIRAHVSSGARGMLKVGAGKTAADEDYLTLQNRFLAIYQQNLCVDSKLFTGIAELLDDLEARNIPWGVITNKSHRFALPLIEALKLRHRAACVIGGDSSPRPKPYADPMHLACTLIGVAPQQCVYVGDDLRDVQSGRAAGMQTIAAAWGYLGDGEPPQNWGASALLHSAHELRHWIAQQHVTAQ